MKHYLTTAALMVAAVSANAGEVTPYVGIDAVHTSIDYKTVQGLNGNDILPKNFKGVSPYVGVQFHPNFAVEASYLASGKESKNFSVGPVNGRSETSFNGIAVDLVGNVKVAEKVKLLGSAGVGRFEAKTNVTTNFGNQSIKEDELTWRVGAGAEYALTDRLGLRAMARYTPVDFNGAADHAATLSAGINYRF